MSKKVKTKMEQCIETNGLGKYVVDDLNLDQAEVIFVLESPHIDELLAGYPVAGKSGRSMTEVLFQDKEAYQCLCKNEIRYEPIGKLIQQNDIINIAIMNIAQIPLQMLAYDCNDIKKHCVIIKQLEIFRATKKSISSEISELILEDFKGRIQKYGAKKIVLCGKFAQAIFKSTGLKFENIIPNIPHPSRGNWGKMDDIKKNMLIGLVNDKTR
jgi:Cu2+-containing amine oxidase